MYQVAASPYIHFNFSKTTRDGIVLMLSLVAIGSGIREFDDSSFLSCWVEGPPIPWETT